jgi:hypothetical protein
LPPVCQLLHVYQLLHVPAAACVPSTHPSLGPGGLIGRTAPTTLGWQSAQSRTTLTHRG